MAKARGGIVSVCFIYWVAVCCADVSPGAECIDPQQRRGVCCLFGRCPIIREEFTRGVTPSFCGFYGRKPLVCCPHEPLVTSTTTPLPPPPTDPPSLPPGQVNVTGPTETVTIPPTDPPPSFGERGGRAKYWCTRYIKICTDMFIGRLENAQQKREVGEIESHFQGGEYITFSQFEKNSSSIVGGVETIPNEFPHMAAIGYGPENDIKWNCGGSLISDKFILTAAHCLHGGRDGEAKWVLLGTVRLVANASLLGDEGQIHEVVDRILHPDYERSDKYNNIGLIEIGPAITPNARSLLSLELHPACLSTDEPTGLDWFLQRIATGWGVVGFQAGASKTIQKVKLDNIDGEMCEEFIKFGRGSSSTLKRGINSIILCAGVLNGGMGTCEEDFGGPLQTVFYANCLYDVWGITSYGTFCGLQDSPKIFSKVPSFIEWIEDKVWPMDQ